MVKSRKAAMRRSKNLTCREGTRLLKRPVMENGRWRYCTKQQKFGANKGDEGKSRRDYAKRRKSPKRKSPKRKSPKRKSPRRRSKSRRCQHGKLKNPVTLPGGRKRYCKLKRKSRKRKSRRKSPKRRSKSRKRKSRRKSSKRRSKSRRRKSRRKSSKRRSKSRRRQKQGRGKKSNFFGYLWGNSGEEPKSEHDKAVDEYDSLFKDHYEGLINSCVFDSLVERYDTYEDSVGLAKEEFLKRGFTAADVQRIAKWEPSEKVTAYNKQYKDIYKTLYNDCTYMELVDLCLEEGRTKADCELAAQNDLGEMTERGRSNAGARDY